jgi:ribonuclease III
LKPDSFSRLSQVLGYRFNNVSLLTVALTHRSFGTPNNERLEFLGDAILTYVMAELLFARFPSANEDQLTRLRADLVKEETLADIAIQLKLGPELRLGSGELKTGGWRRASILADALEAIIGAVYLDANSDILHVKQLIDRLYADRLVELNPKKSKKDAKTSLQEYLQARRLELPLYRVLTVVGNPHEPHFSVECHVAGLEKPTYGEGNNIRNAEQAAAAQALDLLQKLSTRDRAA